ncbi:ABC transporter permease [Pseudoalteromonas sp. NC201]|uniref:ABC transporter permease n=1 Tax=Pseudoalteromonas sp. NC201 TaxID=1514074 RepID=UPI000C7AE0B0|nr:ABC transporter permease [Pseudoalteromonas sp. NC201]AUJ71581.1 ABC-2 family transporter protein [Pseudoalteromonas sp. NC201]
MSHKLQQILQVTKWEFMYFFKLKQELIGKAIMLAIGLLIYFWQSTSFFEPEQYVIATPSAMNLTQLPEPLLLKRVDASKAELLTQLEQEEIDGILILQAQTGEALQFELITTGKMSWQNEVEVALKQFYSNELAQSFNLSAAQLALLQQPVTVSNQYTKDAVKEAHNQSSMTAFGVMLLMLIGIFTSFGQIFVSITGEKQQRVTEQLYSCMNAQTWIDGKIFGQMLHCLKAMLSTLFSFLLAMAFIQVVVKNEALDFTMIDFAMLPWFTLFAIVGLYMATAFMAAIAAAIDDPNHSGKTGFMMIPILPIVIAFMIVDSPSSFAVDILSLFPLTAFVVMPVKMALIEVPIWQVLCALVSALLGCYLIRVAAGRLFKAGMVMYGKEPSIKDMVRWVCKPE